MEAHEQATPADTGKPSSVNQDSSKFPVARCEEGAVPGIVKCQEQNNHNSSVVDFPPLTSQAHGLAVAAGFVELLEVDFVDFVFKVRGGSLFLSAHRTLVAAVFPGLREELRGLKPASRELRARGLAWLELSAGDDLVTNDPYASVSPPDIVDVSMYEWGIFSVIRAVLCYIYGRPITIDSAELQLLRSAAQYFRNTEFVRLCDDEDRRHMTQAVRQGGTAVTDFQQLLTPVPHRQFSVGSSASTNAWSIDSVADGAVTTNSNDEFSSGVCNEAGQSYEAHGDAPDCGDRGADAGKARSRPMATKPRGEYSMHEKEKQAVESGGVQRVLSEIKRSIVDSSRIIADKKFQQMYELVQGERGILGEGINGTVRMALHRKTERQVAVKRISCLNLSEQRRQMLVSEVNIFLQCSHRNIVQLLEVYESDVDQAVLLVMELCTGKELFERLAKRRWYSEFDASQVALQMLDAVSYLHSQNICHRDLKLENWLYENPSQEARLKLCDFGFGQIVEPSVRLTATLGSLYYVAPEVLAGSYGLPCDMWSIGVIVYMLLSGVPPFDGKTDADVMAKINHGRFVSTGKRWESISETAKHFVRCMLRKDPSERWTAAEASQHAWLKMEFQPKTSNWQKGGPDAELELPIDRVVIRDMWQFAQGNAVFRAALGMLSKLSTSSLGGCEGDVLAMEQSFKNYDSKNTGKIEVESFILALKETLKLASSDETYFFERFAGSLPGGEEVEDEQKGRRRREVNYNDFITMIKARRLANNTAAMREAFSQIDEQGHGFIKEDDMHTFLGDEFKAVIDNYVDLNGKEFIDYAHFASIVSKEIASKGESSVQPATPSAIIDETEVEHARIAVPQLPELVGNVSVPSLITSVEEVSLLPAGRAATEPLSVEVVAGSVSDAPPLADAPAERLCDTLASRPRGEAEDEAPVDMNRDLKCEEEVEEECDADAFSDEEQLVNVGGTEEPNDSNMADLISGEDVVCQRAFPEEKFRQPSAPAKESFSLSLAGSSEQDDMNLGVNRVMSMPSDAYSVRQLPGFHSHILRPFYTQRPMSNVLMGLIRGSSLYARQSVSAKLANIIPTKCGWFFIMPNPKYHSEVDHRKGLLSKESGKFRFVAWWIHPRFVAQLRQWFERLTSEGMDQDRQDQRREARAHHEARVQQQRNEREPRTANNGGEALGGEVGNSGWVGSGRGAGCSGSGAGAERTIGGSFAFASGGGSGAGPAATSPVSGDGSCGGDGGIVHSGSASGSGSGSSRCGPILAPSNHDGHLGSRDRASVVGSTSTETPGDASLKRSRQGAPAMNDGAKLAGPVDVVDGAKFPGAGESSHICPSDTGNPGDFRFSDVPKPENYLHTFRDLHSREHVTMLSQLHDGTHRFLRSLFDDNTLSHARVSAGFHYPVRSQYATLHLQVRVNSGSVCRDDGRGIEIGQLIENMTHDRHAFKRDREVLRYHVTENVKVGLLAAAKEYEEQHVDRSACRQTSPLAYELGVAAMPTIRDEDEEEEENDASLPVCAIADTSSEGPESCAEPAVATYLVNLQPSSGSRFYEEVYAQRDECKNIFGPDPTHLFPLHISVTGFFEANESQVSILLQIMKDMLGRELANANRIDVGEVICTKSGYVLFDVKSPAVTAFIRRVAEKSNRELDMHIRPKSVNHISLAANRPDESIRDQIRDGYVGEGAKIKETIASASFDLVLSRLVRRSSFDNFELDGPHQFQEIGRIKVFDPSEFDLS